MTGTELNPVLETAIRELERPLHRYLERYVGHRSVAEDLLQETLIRMSRGYASFAGRSSIKTWAFAIASRVAADYFRHPERKKKIIELDESEEPPATDRPVEEGLIVGEMNDCIREVIDSLPSVTIGVDHQPISAIGQSLLSCDISREDQQPPHEIGLRDFVHRRQMPPGNRQHMSRRLRTDVAEREEVFGLADDCRRDLAPGDLAEETVAHPTPQTPPSSCPTCAGPGSPLREAHPRVPPTAPAPTAVRG